MAKTNILDDQSGKMFGERVRLLRTKQTGLSQEELAVRAGFHRTFIGRVERGETNITLINILRICKALQITASEFFQDFENTLNKEDV